MLGELVAEELGADSVLEADSLVGKMLADWTGGTDLGVAAIDDGLAGDSLGTIDSTDGLGVSEGTAENTGEGDWLAVGSARTSGFFAVADSDALEAGG